jgi:hypothetical protein
MSQQDDNTVTAGGSHLNDNNGRMQNAVVQNQNTLFSSDLIAKFTGNRLTNETTFVSGPDIIQYIESINTYCRNFNITDNTQKKNTLKLFISQQNGDARFVIAKYEKPRYRNITYEELCNDLIAAYARKDQISFKQAVMNLKNLRFEETPETAGINVTRLENACDSVVNMYLHRPEYEPAEETRTINEILYECIFMIKATEILPNLIYNKIFKNHPADHSTKEISDKLTVALRQYHDNEETVEAHYASAVNRSNSYKKDDTRETQNYAKYDNAYKPRNTQMYDRQSRPTYRNNRESSYNRSQSKRRQDFQPWNRERSYSRNKRYISQERKVIPNREQKRFVPTCYTCGKYGHASNKCWFRNQNRVDYNSPRRAYQQPSVSRANIRAHSTRNFQPIRRESHTT